MQHGRAPKLNINRGLHAVPDHQPDARGTLCTVVKLLLLAFLLLLTFLKSIFCISDNRLDPAHTDLDHDANKFQ